MHSLLDGNAIPYVHLSRRSRGVDLAPSQLSDVARQVGF